MGKKRPIFYNALALTGVNLLLRFASTGFQVFLSGQLGAAGVGLLQLVMSVGGLAMTAGMAGIRTATMYLTAGQLGRKQPQNVGRVLSACFVYSILFSGTVSSLLYGLAPRVATDWIGDGRTLGAVRLYCAFLPASCLCGVLTGYYTAANRVGTLALVEIAEQVFSMAVTALALTLWAGSDPGKACQAVVLGSGMGSCLTLLCLILLRKTGPMGPRIQVAKDLMKAALPLMVADNVKAGLTTAENLMVPKRLALFTGLATPLAAFGVVCGMVFPVMMFPAAILFGLAELLIPELARCAAAGSRVRIRYLAGRSLRVAMLYGCLICGILMLSAHKLCELLYGDPLAGQQLQLYAVLVPMLYCDAITDAINKGLGQQAVCMRYNIITAVMDLLGLYLLLPKYGMDGYFISFLISHLANFILSLRLLLRVTGMTLRLRSGLLCLLCLAISGALASSLPNTLAALVSFPALFSCSLYLFRLISKGDLKWLKNLIKT